MRYKLLVILLSLLISCEQKPSFEFKTTSDRLKKTINWDNKIIITDNIGDLYEISGDTLERFDVDSIISITNCRNNFHVLKAPNDTTLILSESNGAKLTIKNKSGQKSKYFSVWTNEKCEVLLECGMLVFKIQGDSLIDLKSVYGFRDITSFNGSDKFGYFDNLIFLTKYPDYFYGGIVKSYLDSDSNKYPLPNDIKVRDFTIHKDELLLVTGFYEIHDDNHVIEKKVLKIKDGKVEELVIKGIPDEMDIALIYSNDNAIYLLSERFGFFQLKDNKLTELISIDLRASKVIPESFVVQDNLIFLSTFENGVIRFTIKNNDFDVKQILTSE